VVLFANVVLRSFQVLVGTRSLSRRMEHAAKPMSLASLKKCLSVGCNAKSFGAIPVLKMVVLVKRRGNIVLCRKFCIENDNINHILIQKKGEVIYEMMMRSALA
jgi:hypothetical protein